MLRASLQRKIFRQKLENANTFLSVFRDKKQPPALHHFRVSVKEAEAMIRLLPLKAGNEESRNYFEPIRQLFKISGSIRDAHMALALSQKLGIREKSLQKKCSSRIAKGCIRMFSKQPEITITLMECNRNVSGLFKDITNKKLESLMRKELKNIAAEIKSTESSVSRLHRLRKKIKRIMYVYPLLPPPVRHKLKWNMDVLQKLTAWIGKLHDLVLMNDILSAKLKQSRKTREIIHTRKEKLKSRVRGILDQFEQRVTA